MVGCVGYPDCTHSLARAIENTEVPDEIFCLEGHPNHPARTDSPCESHAATTNGLRQVIVNFCKLQAEVKKASNRAVKAKENLSVIKITGIVSDRPFLPITLYSAMELSTLVQGSVKVQEEDVKHLPSYIRRLNMQVFDLKP